jgi:hypothetical protein
VHNTDTTACPLHGQIVHLHGQIFIVSYYLQPV